MRLIEAVQTFRFSDDGIAVKEYRPAVYDVVDGEGVPGLGRISVDGAKVAVEEGWAVQVKDRAAPKAAAAGVEEDDDPLSKDTDPTGGQAGTDGGAPSSSAPAQAPTEPVSTESGEQGSSASTPAGDSGPEPTPSTPPTSTGGAARKGKPPPKPKASKG